MLIAYDLPGYLTAVVNTFAKAKQQQVFIVERHDQRMIGVGLEDPKTRALVIYYSPESIPIISTAHFKGIPVVVCADMPIADEVNKKSYAVIQLNQEAEQLKKVLESLDI